jgi:DNA-binding response OmpR family regulator
MERRSEAEAARTLSGARVLVVEDEAIIGFELQASLTDAGAQVIGPSLSLAEAFALASRENLSAAVLDIRLGRETIGPVARQLAARGIPFLFYTGQVETDSIRAEWPHCKIMSKPAPVRALVRAVAKLLHGSRSQANRT